MKLARKQVLRKPGEFAAVAQARSAGGMHRAGRWLALGARVLAGTVPLETAGDDRPLLRLGLTVPRRYAKRAVDRNLIKRVVREAMRALRPRIEAEAAPCARIDVVVRLKAPWPGAAAGSQRQLKGQLRQEADALLALLCRGQGGRV
ncbi:MAG TPA: ribonuclease P protein component [Burkholderiaceae bacterium]|nr:ribonuclease P protein component [Burkholderiaceae bacterium]